MSTRDGKCKKRAGTIGMPRVYDSRRTENKRKPTRFVKRPRETTSLERDIAGALEAAFERSGHLPRCVTAKEKREQRFRLPRQCHLTAAPSRWPLLQQLLRQTQREIKFASGNRCTLTGILANEETHRPTNLLSRTLPGVAPQRLSLHVSSPITNPPLARFF